MPAPFFLFIVSQGLVLQVIHIPEYVILPIFKQQWLESFLYFLSFTYSLTISSKKIYDFKELLWLGLTHSDNLLSNRKTSTPIPNKDFHHGKQQRSSMATTKVGAHRPWPTAFSVDSQSPMRTQYTRCYLEWGFPHTQKTHGKGSVGVCTGLLWPAERVPPDGQNTTPTL